MDTLDAARRPCAPVTQSQPDAGQDYSPGDHIGRDRARDQQEEDRTDEDEHNCQCTSHSWWRAHQGGGVFHQPGKRGWQAQTETSQPESARQEQLSSCSKTSGYLEESAWEPNSASSTPMWSQSCSVSVSVSAQDGIVALGKAHMRSAPSLSSLPKVALETVPIFVWLNTDCSRPWRVECRQSPALRMWDMADNRDHVTKDPDILQHLSEVNLQSPMARKDPKWRSVGVCGTGTSGQADTAEEVGLGRTHPQEASIQHHTPSPDLKPAGVEKERPASQWLEARYWSRAETARDRLVRNDQSSPEQSAMSRGRWWPMLHWESWA